MRNVAAEIAKKCQETENGSAEISDGDYSIEFTKLSDLGETIDSAIVESFPRGTYGVNSGLRPRDNIETGPVTDPILVRFQHIDDPAHRIKALRRNLTKASSQLKNSERSLAVIDSGISDFEMETREYTEMKNVLTEDLGRYHQKLDAVVLMAHYGSISMDGVFTWRVRTDLLKGSGGLLDTPDIEFPGDGRSLEWIEGEWFQEPVIPLAAHIET